MKLYNYFILFGATGDLALTKIIPALFELYQANELPDTFKLLGLSRSKLSPQDYQKIIKQALLQKQFSPEEIESFLSSINYIPFDYQTGCIATTIQSVSNFATDNYVFYLAIPPQGFQDVIQCISSFRQDQPTAQLRVVVEKPFGQDLQSAQNLNKLLQSFLQEDQIYRMDHYLGKETVQNILALRFGNTLFDPLLNDTYVEQIELDLWEEKGIDLRADYFDSSGIIKDVLQNHILQILSLLMMETPAKYENNFIRDEKHKFLASLKPINNEDVIIAQYSENPEAGLKGYLQEQDIPASSTTETMIQMKLVVDNQRWNDIPVIITAGKRMKESKTEIRITFKPTFTLFNYQDQECQPQKNTLVIQIQPEEKVYFMINAKFPGKGMCIHPANMHFTYQESFKLKSRDAYTRLIQDILEGDQMLFIRSDEIESQWQYVSRLLQAKQNGELKLHTYKAGTGGDTIPK